MNSCRGTHVIADLYNVPKAVFMDLDRFDSFDLFMADALRRHKMNVLNKTLHRFSDNGALTCLWLLSESHVSIHTWPENSYIALDAMTCGSCRTEDLMDEIVRRLCPGRTRIRVLQRGLES